jgi:hypothetical protein
MTFRTVRTLLPFRFVALALLLPAAALAQNAAFTLLQGDKPVGKDTYTLAKAKNGFKLSSRYSYHLNGTEFSFQNDLKFNDAYGYLEGGSNNNATQSHLSFAPNKPQTDLTITTLQAGIMDSHHLAVKPGFVLLPVYDPGAAQVMLLLATTHPSADNLYSIVVPSSASAPPSADGSPVQGTAGNFAYDALWTKSPDTTGTLDGKPTPVHAYTLKTGNNTWIFYAADDNTLLQCDVSMLHASYIRNGFKLDTH